MAELKVGTVYLIRHNEEKWHHYEGTYKGYTIPIGYNNVYPTFKNVIKYKYTIHANKEHYDDSNYYEHDDFPTHIEVALIDFKNITFYDAEKVKSAKKAIQNRDRRIVNMILRRLIGDKHFEW